MRERERERSYPEPGPCSDQEPWLCDGARETLKPYLNPSASAFAHSIGDSSSRRVNHGDKTHEAEVIHREIDFISVKLEAFGKLFVRQKEVAETYKEEGKYLLGSQYSEGQLQPFNHQDSLGYMLNVKVLGLTQSQ